MILFFDTETTGLPDYKIPVDHKSQPYLVQLACLLTEDDGKERASLSVIIDPDGFDIPKQASDIHGITNEIARRFGIPSVVALAAFTNFRAQASRIVAHNIKFDLHVIETALARTGRASRHPGPSDRFCTMEKASPIVDLPPTPRMLEYGFDKPKNPTLTECVRHFFDEDLKGAHDALTDVRACALVYFHLQTFKQERITA